MNPSNNLVDPSFFSNTYGDAVFFPKFFLFRKIRDNKGKCIIKRGLTFGILQTCEECIKNYKVIRHLFFNKRKNGEKRKIDYVYYLTNYRKKEKTTKMTQHNVNMMFEAPQPSAHSCDETIIKAALPQNYTQELWFLLFQTLQEFASHPCKGVNAPMDSAEFNTSYTQQILRLREVLRVCREKKRECQNNPFVFASCHRSR